MCTTVDVADLKAFAQDQAAKLNDKTTYPRDTPGEKVRAQLFALQLKCCELLSISKQDKHRAKKGGILLQLYCDFSAAWLRYEMDPETSATKTELLNAVDVAKHALASISRVPVTGLKSFGLFKTSSDQHVAKLTHLVDQIPGIKG